MNPDTRTETTATAVAPVPRGTDALDVCGVSVELGGRLVLEDIDLRVGTGELVGLVGPNGAGKTTLLRTILGVQPIIAGSVTVTTEGTRSGIGYVPQRHEFAWDFPIDVAGVVLSGRTGDLGWFRRPGTEDYRAVRRALRRVEMDDLADRPVGELSGGQRQRVLVARALALEPQVLLLDEPFTGLDVPTQELLTTLFSDLAAEGRAVLMTTHDLTSAMVTCRRLCMLNRTVVADGPPEELRDGELWVRTFGFSPASPLLRAIGVS